MASPPPPRIISPGGPQRQPSLPDLSSTASPTSPSSSSSSAVQARTSYFAGAHSNTIPSPSNPHSTTSPEHADTSEYDDGSHERAEAALQAAAQYSERQDEEHIYGEQQHSSSYDFSRSPEPSDHILPPQASGSPSASTSISSSDFSRSSRALYASYFFAAWGDRMWEFAAIIFLIDLFPSSLLYSSVFGLVEKLAGIAAGPEIGRAVDQSDRLSLVRWTILGQNGSVCFASVLFWAALSSITLAPDGTNPNSPDARTVVSYLFILVMGAIAAVASMANKVAIHKDWVVVICGEDDTRLTRLNSNMRRIDLGCSVLAPLLVGLLSIASSSTAVGCVAVWSAVSLVVEYHLIGWVYERIPALQGKSERFQERERAKREASQRQQPEEIAADEHRLPPPRIDVEDPSTNPVRIEDVELPMHLRVLHRSKRFLVTFKDEMRAYYAHPVFLASLAYALLYISVLSLGGIMAAWLKIQGVSNTVIAVVRGIAASVGIASTYCVPWMIARWGLLRAGLVAVWSQAAMLLPVAFSFVYYFRDRSAKTLCWSVFRRGFVCEREDGGIWC
jgi:iron-regulated transporter 1